MNTTLENLKYPIGKYQKPEIISENDIKTWIETIKNFPFQIKNATQNLSAEQLNWIYRPDGWTIKQVVHHCADSHINSFVRFKLALTEENPTIKPYEEADWAKLADGISDDISASLLLIEGVHKRWVLLLKSFGVVEFSKKFTHPATNKTSCLDEVLGLYAWHCNHHLAHIKQAVLYKGQF